jgi:DNA-binding NarL/FixJ family response regulator
MTPNKDMPHTQLSNREFEVFNMLVSGKTLTDIGEQLHLSVKTVSTHKTRIMQKMQMNSLSEIIQYAVAHQLLNSV